MDEEYSLCSSINFLADTTIRENIAFGVPKNEINNDLIHSSIQKAQLSKFINDLKNGLDEIVGERGIRILVDSYKELVLRVHYIKKRH